MVQRVWVWLCHFWRLLEARQQSVDISPLVVRTRRSTTKRISERAPSRSIQSAGAHRLRAERQWRLTERPDYAKAADTGPP